MDFSNYGIDATFCIQDNSLSGFDLSSIERMLGRVNYYHSGENKKLSIVYNELIKDNCECDYYIILDDDSVIDSSYLLSLLPFFESDVKVAIPLIKHNGDLISPGRVSGVRGHALKESDVDIGVVKSSNLVAMMSGTVLSKSIVEELRFDERLSFYGVDTKFFLSYSRIYDVIFILNTILEHESALRDNLSDFSSLKRRLTNLILSKVYVFDDVKFHRIKISLYVLAFVSKKIITTKNLSYILLLNTIRSIMTKAK
ncbi:glycosyltransferase [Pseudomonas sp. JL3]|nr:glycosyltransferase [Pseudomonas sp. JL3]